MLYVAELFRGLAQRRVSNPDFPATANGAKLADEAAMCQSVLAATKEAIASRGFPTGAHADEAVDALMTVKNWALSLQQVTAKLPSDHPMRKQLEPLRVIERDAYDLALRIQNEQASAPANYAKDATGTTANVPANTAPAPSATPAPASPAANTPPAATPAPASAAATPPAPQHP